MNIFTENIYLQPYLIILEELNKKEYLWVGNLDDKLKKSLINYLKIMVI